MTSIIDDGTFGFARQTTYAVSSLNCGTNFDRPSNFLETALTLSKLIPLIIRA